MSGIQLAREQLPLVIVPPSKKLAELIMHRMRSIVKEIEYICLLSKMARG